MSASVCSSLNPCCSVWTWNDAIRFKGFWANNGDGSLFCWCVTGSAEALRDGRALVVKHTNSSCALLPTAGHLFYCNTWPRVSGNFVARKLPAASAPAANKMGTALVMPTNDWKMLMPRTAASLQKAFRKPNAVVLNTEEEGHRWSHEEFQQLAQAVVQ